MKEINNSEAPDAEQLRQQMDQLLRSFSFWTLCCAAAAFLCCANLVSWTGVAVGFVLGLSSVLVYGSILQTVLGARVSPVRLSAGLALKIGVIGYAVMVLDLSEARFIFSAIAAFLLLLPAATGQLAFRQR